MARLSCAREFFTYVHFKDLSNLTQYSSTFRGVVPGADIDSHPESDN